VLGAQVGPGARGATLMTLHLSSALPDAGTRVDDAVAQRLFGRVSHLEFRTVLDGQPLRTAALSCPGAPMFTDYVGRVRPSLLSGSKVMLNPGHGWTRDDAGTWALQRGLVNLTAAPPVYVQEDASNLEQAIAVNASLTAAGATVLSARSLDKTAANGASGHPLWQEGARANLERLGVPAGVWDSERTSIDQGCGIDKDVRARPLYANFAGADLLVSLHSNASTAQWTTVRGTRVYYSTDNALAGTPGTQIGESSRLATALGQQVVAAIRAERPDLNWPDAQIIGSGNYGENRFARMPAVIIETGFHTNLIDGPALGQDSFRQAVAHGVQSGLRQYLGDVGGPVVAPPLPPTQPAFPGAPGPVTPGSASTLQVSAAAPVTFSWQGVSGATRYGLYISKYPYGAANLVYANEQLTAPLISLSLDAANFRAAGETRYRWNMTAFRGPNDTDNGDFSPALAFTLVDPVLPPTLPAPPATPTPLVAAMSSGGRMLLSWPEVSGALDYAFTATVGGQAATLTGRALAGKSALGAAVVLPVLTATLADGTLVCFQVQASSAGGTSAAPAPACVAFQAYSAVQGLSLRGQAPTELWLKMP